MAEDLDQRLSVDDCEMCGAVDWKDCVCVPAPQRRAPTAVEIERGRSSRLSRREIETQGAPSWNG